MKLGEFVHSGRAAIEDLQTLIRIDSDAGRVSFSCSRSTVKFLATLVVSSFLVIFTLRAIFKLVRGTPLNSRNNNVELVYKRDRSLGGREVLVAKNETIDRKKPNVLDSDDRNSNWDWDRDSPIRFSRSRKKKSPVEQLPKWWPVSSSGSDQVEAENQQEYQRMANRLIRGNFIFQVIVRYAAVFSFIVVQLFFSFIVMQLFFLVRIVILFSPLKNGRHELLASKMIVSYAVPFKSQFTNLLSSHLGQ